MSVSDKAGDKSGEASMDDILASIRKIIADDPAAPKAGSALRPGPPFDSRALNPLLGPSPSPLRASDGFDTQAPLLPAASKFGGALNSVQDMLSSAPPLPPVPPPRPRPFRDFALDDLIEGPATAAGSQPGSELPPPPPPAPVTSTGNAAAATTPASDPWSAWRNLKSAAHAGLEPEPVASKFPAILPSDLPPPDLRIEPPFGAELQSRVEPEAGVEEKAVVEQETRVDPDTRAEPNGTSHAGFDATTALEAGTPLDSGPALNTALGSDISPRDEASALDSPPDTPATALAPPAPRNSFYPPKPSQPVRRQPVSFSSVFPRAAQAATVAATDPAPDLSAAGAAETTAPPAALTEPFVTLPEPATGASIEPSTVEPTRAAAHEALEKLAAGLNQPPAEHVRPTRMPMTPPFDSAPTPSASMAAPAPSTANGAAAPSSGQPATSRTLDDLVTDMLRPMLERWVEANMPRLMEKALRPQPPKDGGGSTR